MTRNDVSCARQSLILFWKDIELCLLIGCGDSDPPPTSDLVIPTLDTCTRQTDQLFCTTKANVRSRVNRICPALLRISLTEEMADDFRIASCISRSSSVSKPNYCSVQHMPRTPCLSAYRCLIGTAPSYLGETLHSTADVGSRRRLRSASKSTLVIPSTRRTALGDRSFQVTAARAWNALPSSVRSASSLLQFRRDLKTALFQSSYSSP